MLYYEDQNQILGFYKEQGDNASYTSVEQLHQAILHPSYVVLVYSPGSQKEPLENKQMKSGQ